MDLDQVTKLTPESNDGNFGRRTFLGAAALAGAFFSACSPAGETTAKPGGAKMTPGPLQAPDGRPLRAGLIGCGGRGTGAAMDFLNSGPNLQVVAVSDIFQDRMDNCRKQLKEQKDIEIPDNRCYPGFDGYKALLESDIDVVIQATPPHFRPEHFAAIVEARKHVFMEKPVAVDPWGARSIMATAEKADAFNLCVVTGTQYRHQKSYVETYNRIQDGAIGELKALRSLDLRGQLWYREPRPEWTEMEAMLRDWVNWQWLSGDHNVEQHIHNIDVLFWFANSFPVRSIAVGGRARRVTGDQYDFFASEWELESGLHMSTMCRQVDGCTNNISTWVVGTKGYTNCANTIFGATGEIIWKYEGEGDNSPYVQEHVDWVTAIRQEKPVNEAVNMAKSTLGAIMSRESAYTGLETTWSEMMQSEQRLGPTEYSFGPVGLPAQPPVPGVQKA